MMKFVLILFFVFNSFSVLCQTKTDSTENKKEETKKRFLHRLDSSDKRYFQQYDLMYWGKMKQPEKLDLKIKLTDKQIQENQTIILRKNAQLHQRLWMVPPKP